MIKFSAELTVKKIENKAVRKRDGGTFEFTEVTLEQAGKRPTLLVARASEEVLPVLREGLKGEFEIGITSFTMNDGRTFNNFLVTFFDSKEDTKEQVQPLETALKDIPDDFGDDIPF